MDKEQLRTLTEAELVRLSRVPGGLVDAINELQRRRLGVIAGEIVSPYPEEHAASLLSLIRDIGRLKGKGRIVANNPAEIERR